MTIIRITRFDPPRRPKRFELTHTWPKTWRIESNGSVFEAFTSLMRKLRKPKGWRADIPRAAEAISDEVVQIIAHQCKTSATDDLRKKIVVIGARYMHSRDSDDLNTLTSLDQKIFSRLLKWLVKGLNMLEHIAPDGRIAQILSKSHGRADRRLSRLTEHVRNAVKEVEATLELPGRGSGQPRRDHEQQLVSDCVALIEEYGQTPSAFYDSEDKITRGRLVAVTQAIHGAVLNPKTERLIGEASIKHRRDKMVPLSLPPWEEPPPSDLRTGLQFIHYKSIPATWQHPAS